MRLQGALSEEPIQTPGGALKIRIGLHTGHAEPTGGDYAFSTFDVASRIQSRACGGEILVTRETQVLVNRRLRGVKFIDAGSCELKGVGPQHVFRVVRLSTEPEPEPVKIQNAYGFSGTVSHGTFKGRQTELDELVDSIESGTHTAIFGLQRMGKTSLIKEGPEERIQNSPELQKQVLLADIDLMKLGDDEVTYKDLFHAIIQSITTKLLDAGIGKRVVACAVGANKIS